MLLLTDVMVTSFLFDTGSNSRRGKRLPCLQSYTVTEGSWCPTSLLYSQRRNTTTPAKAMLPETLAAARLQVAQVVRVVANAFLVCDSFVVL
jgi:hypothetical protein